MQFHHNIYKSNYKVQLGARRDILTIDRIKSNKILITLGNEDMRDFSLDYDTLSLYDNHCRKIIMRILQVACFKTDIEIKDKKMTVEALPTVNGCILLLTVEDRKSRRYRLQNRKNCYCYEVGNSKNFLEVIRLLYRQNVCCNKNSAYEQNGTYYLVFDYPAVPKRFKRILHEYGARCGSNVFAARLRENAKEICKTNAVAVIGRWL